jgi:hypothetical protein
MLSNFVVKRHLSQLLFRHEGRQITGAAAVAPLVVIPGKHFGHLAFHDHDRKRIDDRRSRVTAKITGSQGLVAIVQDAALNASSSFLSESFTASAVAAEKRFKSPSTCLRTNGVDLKTLMIIRSC